MKADLIQAYNQLLQIPVAGPAVKSMFMAQSLIEKTINEMPDDPITKTGKENQNKGGETNEIPDAK